MNPDAHLIISLVQRKHTITVRWTSGYLLSRIVLLLTFSNEFILKSQLVHAVTLLTNPSWLYKELSSRGVNVPAEVFPHYILNTFSNALPQSTHVYDQALSVGLARGLLATRREKDTLFFGLTDLGLNLQKQLAHASPLDYERAQFARHVMV